jgi:hypothetical protein
VISRTIIGPLVSAILLGGHRSVKDTPGSIREAVAWNRAIDKRCGVKGGT